MDSILFWNAVALEADRVAHTDPAKREQNGPILSSRALAIVHLAMYDAYAGVENDPAKFPPYLGVVGVPGTSHRDAVAGAAFTTLSALYRTQRDYFEAQLSGFDKANLSFDFGVVVGNTMLDQRKNDPDARDCGYMVSPARGRHRPDPDNPRQGFYAPFYGAQSLGFAITTRWALDQPPPVSFDKPKSEYETALRQVKARGIMPELMATLRGNSFDDRRTPEQSNVGIFWAYDGAVGLGTPPRLYNQIIRRVAVKQANSEGDNARLFAFVNTAMADAGILAWEQKYCHDFWRPVVGIREHDESFGPAARDAEDAVNNVDNDADPFWLPFGAPSTNTTNKNFTPNFPAYPSGHATFGAAAFQITRLFYEVKDNRGPDDLFDGLSFVSDELNGGNRDNRGTVRPRHVRKWKGGLWDMIFENARSRIFLGVHWIFDAFTLDKDGKPDLGRNVGGVVLGLNIAEDIFASGAGRAPKKTPDGAASPPLTTPAPNTPMPTTPAQPSSAKDCAGSRGGQVGGAVAAEPIQQPYPSGLSRR